MLGRACESRAGILEAEGILLAGLLAASSAADEGVPGTIKETEDC